MRKTLLALAVIGFFYFTYVILTDWYNNVESNLASKQEKTIQEQKNVAGFENPGRPRVNAPATPSTSSGTSTPSSSGSGSPKALILSRPNVIKTDRPDVVICLREIEAFDPKNGKLIGKFKKDTKLHVGLKDSVTGKYFVVYEQPGGKLFTALCKSEDLGK